MGSDSAYGEPFYKKEELYQRKKFRGKRMGDGKWLYGSLVTGLFFGLMVSSNGERMASCTHIFDPDIEPDYDNFGDFDEIDCEVSPETVGQLRPTPDADDNPLYEGDIVESEYMRYVVTDIGYEPIGAGEYLSFSDNTELRKVGNIFDNPELLEDR